MGLVKQKYSDDFMSFSEFLKFNIVYFNFSPHKCPLLLKYDEIIPLFYRLDY